DGLRPSHEDASRRGAARVVAGTVLAAVTVLIVFPLAWLIVLAVRSVAQTGGTSLAAALWGEVGTVWSNGFGAAFLVSLGIAVPVAAGVVVLALPAAFALFSSRRRAVRGVGAVVLAIGLFQPASVLVIPLFSTLRAIVL